VTGTPSPRARRRRVPRLGWQAAALGAGLAVALVLAQNTAGAAFTATTGNAADQVSSAASFCPGPGSTTLNPSEDTSGYQAQATTNYGASSPIGTVSANGANARAFLRFPLPNLGYCTVTGATLRLYANSVASGRTINVYTADQAAPVWTELGLTWTNQPASTGTPVGVASLSAVGWQQWTVTNLVKALYTGTNNGLVVQDSAENKSPGSATQQYDSREGTNVPQLLLTWG
jgi:hypothetical protein